MVESLTNNISVENSRARNKYQMSNQKVVFKMRGVTCGEIEMRNDSDLHYREIKFWMSKKAVINLLTEEIKPVKEHSDRIIVFGKATKKFGKWVDEGVRSRH